MKYLTIADIGKNLSKLEHSNAYTLITEILNPLIESLQCDLTVTSGYRPPTVNQTIGGVNTSDHCYAAAADIIPATKGFLVKDLFSRVIKLNLPYRQAILSRELVQGTSGKLRYVQWLHLACNHPSAITKHEAFIEDRPLQGNAKYTAWKGTLPDWDFT